jgi:myosin-1
LIRFALLSKKTFPKYDGDPKEGCQIIMNELGIEKAEWELGKEKMFVKSPETLNLMEEMKDRIYENATIVIQKKYKNYKLKQYFLDLRTNATDLLQGKKERRRLSINRVFLGEYLNYSSNGQLQQVMKEHEKDGPLVFGDIFFKPIRKTFGGHRIEKLSGILTPKSLCFIERVQIKKQFITKYF